MMGTDRGRMPVAPAPALVVGPGDYLNLSQDDVYNRLGRLRMVVRKVDADLRRFPRLEWVAVIGNEVTADGLSEDELTVIVRVAGLRDAARSVGRAA